MKTAIYIEGKDVQIVLTPETPFEHKVLTIPNGTKLVVNRGSFYVCNGGYWRGSLDGRSDDSLILRVEQEAPADPTRE